MQVLPIDLTALAAVILGISVVLVPVIGLTARFAFKPVVEALARIFEDRNADETVRMLERRIELQEHELTSLHATVRQLVDGRDSRNPVQLPGGGRSRGAQGLQRAGSGEYAGRDASRR